MGQQTANTAEVFNKATGAVTQASLDALDLNAPSVVRLHIDRASVVAMVRDGDDLIVRLADGREIRVADFFQETQGVASDIVFEDGDGKQWFAQLTDSGPRYSAIDDVKDLVGAEGGPAGGGLGLLGILGGVGGAGAVAAAAGGGGGGNGGGGGSTPPTGGGTTPPDTTAPARPSATVSPNGGLVTGLGEAGASVVVRDSNGVVLGRGAVGADGNYSVPLSPAQNNGGTVTVVQTDAAGNASDPTNATAPDITAPAAPEAGMSEDGTRIDGTGEPGATIRVVNNAGQQVGTADVNDDGSYTVTLSPTQANGEVLTITQIDDAGNVSPETIRQAPDLTAPAAPVAGVASDGASVTGTGEPGASVRVDDGTGQQIGTGTVGPDGSYTVPLSPAQTGGGSVSVVQTDGAGNESDPTVAAAPDLTAPAAPVATIAADGASVTGTGEPGATVRVTNAAGQQIGTALVGADGSYSAALTPAQVNGEPLQVRQADAAANVSAPASLTAPDLTDPAAPIVSIDATGTTITGTGEPGATIRVNGPAGTPIGTATVGADGSFTVPLTPPQANGETLTVVQLDPAGNNSTPVSIAAPDVTAPPPPTITINGDGTAATGSGEAGATVTLTDPDGVVLGTAVVGANGDYATALSPAQVDGQTVTAFQTDRAGNPSGSASAIAPDFVAPAAPAATVNGDGTGVTGTGEPGATIAVTNAAGATIGTATVAADGSFSAPLTPAQANGETLRVVQTDPAGNGSAPLDLTAPDITAPAAPAAAIDATGSLITGTGEAGAAITVRDGNGAVLATGVANAAGAFSIALPAAQIDSQPLSVTQADGAGNPSPATPLTAPDLTAPGAPVGTVAANGAALTGTGEAGATVIVTDPIGAEIGRGTVAGDGSFTVPLTPPQTNGEVLAATQTDAAGNVSPPANPVAPDLVLNDSPDAPTATVSADGAQVTGLAGANATVTVTGPGGVPLGTVIAAGDGSYTVALATPQRNGEELRVIQADAEGDRSPPAIAFAPDLTAPQQHTAVLDDAGASVTGTGEPGAAITITNDDGEVVGTGTVTPRGRYAVVLSEPHVDGELLTVEHEDAAGNGSPPIVLTAPDLTASDAPIATISGDGAIVSGTAAPGETVSVLTADGQLLGSAVAAADGSFAITLATAQVDGEALQVVQEDAAGNVSPATALVAPDLTAPAAPSATVSGDGASVSGSGEAGASVSITNPAGAVVGTATVGANGTYTATLAPPQANGEVLSVVQTDTAGNGSPATTATAPDLTAPGAPDATVSADGTSVTGTGEAGATVTVTNAAGATIGSGTVAANGSYTVALTPAQANGQVLTVVQADAASNVSAPANPVAPDITAPAVPTLAVAANGASVSGTGEPGATVTITAPGGAILGTAVVAANGSYAATLSTPQTDGQLLSATQRDPAGNPSPVATAFAPDLGLPAAPVASVNADGTAVTGTGEPGASVAVTDAAGNVIGRALVAGDGSFSAPLTPPQANGETLSVTQADTAGNGSPATVITAPDITPPAIPAATLSADGAQLTGSGEPGATVTVTNAGGTIGTGIVAPDGSFTIPLTPAQANGEVLTVGQADPAGNASPTLSVTAPDITAPPAPTITVSGDGATATGIGEAGATVTITGPGGAVLGTALVAGDRSYSAPLSTPQVNGETLTVSQRDAAGNNSPSATGLAPDLVDPNAPTAAVSADGAQVTGTGEPGATITITDPAGTAIGMAQVASDGSYAVTLTTPQRNGETLTATQSDAAGNASPPVTAVAPDLTAPAAPAGTVSADGAAVVGTGEPGATITITSPAGAPIGTATVGTDGSFTAALTPAQRNGEVLGIVQRDGAGNASPVVNAAAPDLTAPGAPTGTVSADGTSIAGTGEAGATVTIRNGANAVIGTAVVASDGSYSTTLNPPQANGGTLSVGQADTAGNPSPTASVAAPDITPPAAPVATVAANGASVTGTGEAGTTVTVTTPTGTPLGSGTVAPDGSYTVPISPAQANGELVRVTLTDGAGNVSPATAALAPDITAPAAPSASVSPDGALVTGTGEPGATVIVTGPGGVTGTAVVATNGSYTATLSTPLTDGETVAVTQRDAAGNVSPITNALAPDGTAPLVPTATVTADGTAVTGTGVAGSTITVTSAAGAVLGTATVQGDGSYAATLTTPQRNGETLGVTQADGAGNVSPRLPVLAPDITAPAAPTLTVAGDGATVTGLGEAGATITLTNAAGAVIGTATVAADGSYAAALTPAQANGGTITATQADAAGNISAPVSAAAPDITAPLAPANLAVGGDGLSVTGTGEPGANVTVRNAGGSVIGTGVVAGDGSFTVPLTGAQVTGATLGVTLTDAAGNQSLPGSVIAPFDIDAFDNVATASVDLLPVTTAVNSGTANYVALVSVGLLDLNANVLGIPTVNFTVQPGHTYNATFTYDALLSIGVLSGYSVVVQRFDGTSWVAVEGTGNASLVELGLLNGDLVATDSFGPGQYRAFLTFQGAAGVGLLGSLNVAGTDSDFTDVGSAVPGVTSGNVITNAGPNGEVDIVNAQTVVRSVTINGVTTLVTADGTVVDGAHGTLVMNRNGSYTYTPDADAGAIGQTETVTYTLIDPSDGELESATLSIAIGSPDVTGAALAVNDSDVAGITFRNVETVTPTALEFSFSTPGTIAVPVTRSGNDTFTVAANTTADVTITAIRTGLLSVLPTYTITVYDAANAVVRTVTQTAVAGLPLGSGTALVLDDLPAGAYHYTVSSTNVLGTGYSTSVYIDETVTHLDQFSVTGTTAADGSLLANDTLGTDFPVVRINTGAGFAEIGNTPITVNGLHGSLTVDEVGNYVYRPSTTMAYSAVDVVDSFTYQLVQPNGTVSTATLNVTVDVPADGTLAQTLSLSAANDDVVALGGFDDASISFAAPPVDVPQLPAFETPDELQIVLGNYLSSAPVEQAASAPVSIEIAEAPPVADPLDYLVLPDDLTRHELRAEVHV